MAIFIKGNGAAAGGGGTVDTVQAGTGISVDATDPANPIVSSTVVDTNDAVKVSSNDTTPGDLEAKLVAGTNITLTTNNDGSNETLTIAAAGGVTGFTASQNTTSPNDVYNASRLLVDASSLTADAVIEPKNGGALLAQLPDSTSTGGNKRGLQAVDLQTNRTIATAVASGARAVVLGGKNNTASGTNSLCGGETSTASSNHTIAIGDQAKATDSHCIALGNVNEATKDYAASVGGLGNKATNDWSAVFGGSSNTASGDYSGILAGSNNLASGIRAVVTGGLSNEASGELSSIAGGASALANKYGMRAYASGAFAARGDCQQEQYVQRIQTTTDAQTELSNDGAAPGAGDRIAIASDATYTFTGLVTARRTDADNESAGWEIKGVIDNNAGTTALVGSATVTALGDDSSGTWLVAVEADDTNDALVIKVTGENSKTIRWAATVELMKVKG